MATFRPKWFLISPALTASGAFSEMTAYSSGYGQLPMGSWDELCCGTAVSFERMGDEEQPSTHV